MPIPISFSFAALLTGVIAATVVDIRTRRIPNVLTGSLALVGVGIAATGLSEVSLGAAALGVIVGLALMLPGHVIGATGAGDVKLMAAVGSLLGPGGAAKAVLFTALAGGVLAIVVALRRKRLAETLAVTARMVAMPSEVKTEVRFAAPSSRFAYGPAIAIGSLIAAVMG